MTERYKGVTTKSHHTDPALQLITKYPKLKELFGEDWLREIIREGQDVNSVHPLLWELAASRDVFAESIIRLVEEVPGGKSDVKNLKNCPTFSDLIAAIREIETYSELRRKGYEVTWKPKIAQKNPDLLIHAELPIYLEVFAITPSDSDRSEQIARDKVLAEINKIEPNPYILSIHHRKPLIEEHTQILVDFVRDKIATLQPQDLKTEFECQVNGETIAEITFMQAPEGRTGGVMSQMFGGMINNSGRIKNRILDKLQNFQLPPKVESDHLNGYLLYLESTFYDSMDVETAIKGQHTIRFEMKDGVPVEGGQTTPGYAPNGVVHSSSWTESISNNLDFFASTKPDNGVILLDSKSMVLVSEKIKVPPEKLKEILFWA